MVLQTAQNTRFQELEGAAGMEETLTGGEFDWIEAALFCQRACPMQESREDFHERLQSRARLAAQHRLSFIFEQENGDLPALEKALDYRELCQE